MPRGAQPASLCADLERLALLLGKRGDRAAQPLLGRSGAVPGRRVELADAMRDCGGDGGSCVVLAWIAASAVALFASAGSDPNGAKHNVGRCEGARVRRQEGSVCHMCVHNWLRERDPYPTPLTPRILHGV